MTAWRLACSLIMTAVTGAELRGGLRAQDAAQLTCAPFRQWPNVDGVTCDACRALVLTSPYGGSCEDYCKSFNHSCAAAAEEMAEDCKVRFTFECNQRITDTSDMLCTCHLPPGVTLAPTPAPTEGTYTKKTGDCRRMLGWCETEEPWKYTGWWNEELCKQACDADSRCTGFKESRGKCALMTGPHVTGSGGSGSCWVKKAQGSTSATALAADVSATLETAHSKKWWLRAAAMQTVSPSCYGMTLSDLYAYLDKLHDNGVYTLTINAVYDHGDGYSQMPPSGENPLWCGLAISDPMNVNSVFGNVSEFDRFVETAHAKGMRVMSWFNPSYWWTGSASVKQAEEDIKTGDVPADSPAHWFDWRSFRSGKTKPPDDAPGSHGRSVSGDSHPGGWVWDDDASHSYWSKWAFQPTTNFGSDVWKNEFEKIARYWIIDRKLDGFTYDDPHGYYNIYGFKENYADLMRNLSNDSFFQNAEIYGDPHSGLEFGMESVLPGSWNDDKEIFGWVANDIKRGNMDDLDGVFATYYDKYADVNRDAGDLLIFPWMRQMLDPFGCDKAKNMITRAVTVAAGFLAVTEKTRQGAAWEDEWWTPDPYTGAAGLKDLAIAMENCDAFNHGTIRERVKIFGGTQKQYAILRYFDYGFTGCGNNACEKEVCVSCADRISWVQSHDGLSWQDAASKVADEFPDGTCDSCAGRGADPKERISTQGFAIFNFEDHEVSFTLELPLRLQHKLATNCVTKQTMNMSATIEVTLSANEFRMFKAN